MTDTSDTTVDRLRTRLADDLRTALRARDQIRVVALRSTMGALDNAGAVPADASARPPAIGPGAADVPRRTLDAPQVRAIVEAEIRERDDAARQFREVGRADAASRVRAEADVLRPYLDGW